MTDYITLRRAAEQALEALEDIGDECGFTSKRTVPKRRRAITALLAALDEPVQKPQGCDYCNHPLYAGINCRVCGRVTRPDAYCITAPDGECVSTDPRCMHNLPAKHQTAEIERAVAAEREACALVCEAQEDDGGEWDVQQQCANAIRARGEK